MSFFKRLFSADYRAAVSAEAAGDLELAAERYALAGHHDAAVRVHLARAERASSRADEVEALRDALHWAPPEGGLRREVSRALGLAIFGRARAEGIATERDRLRVREAAGLLEEGGEFLAAGEAWEAIGDEARAVRAYGRGGLVDRMEEVLSREEARTNRRRGVRAAFADYRMHLRAGARDAARSSLLQCMELAEDKGEYRRLLDELESSLITGGRAVLRVRQGDQITLCATRRIVIGRDPLCELSLRTGGVSRRHAEILCDESGYRLRDAGSRNGTLVGGLPVAGEVPLEGTGSFALGDDCDIDYAVSEEPARLSLEVTSGLDRGARLLAAPAEVAIDLAPASHVPAAVEFCDGRPLLQPTREGAGMRLGGEPVAHGRVQLCHGDQLTIDGIEVDVL